MDDVDMEKKDEDTSEQDASQVRLYLSSLCKLAL